MLKNWENGFVELFNPDSVILYLKNGCRAECYRDKVYVSRAVDGVFAAGRNYDRERLKKFLNGESELCRIKEIVNLDRIEEYCDYYQLLFMSGYLMRKKIIYRGYNDECYDVMIPNREIWEIFAKCAKAHGYEVCKPQK